MDKPVFRLSDVPGGTVFHVRVSPGAARDKVIGEYGGSLKVSITAPPEKGKANAAMLKLLAKEMGLGKNELDIVSGETARDKRVLLRGRSMPEVLELLLEVIEK